VHYDTYGGKRSVSDNKSAMTKWEIEGDGVLRRVYEMSGGRTSLLGERILHAEG